MLEVLGTHGAPLSKNVISFDKAFLRTFIVPMEGGYKNTIQLRLVM